MRSAWREYLEALLIAVIFAVFVRTYVAQAFKIPTPSMEENLLVGDHILVNKLIYGPAGSSAAHRMLPMRSVRRGDVVVFRFPEDPSRDFIKRCVGLPGDRVELRDKVLFVNGEPVDESGYVRYSDSRVYPSSVFLPDDYRYRDNFGPVTVAPGELFFLGDNRDDSHDSRFWGTVPVHLVKGRAVVVYWSFDTEHEVSGWPGYLARLRQLANVVVRFPSSTRWHRTFRLVR